MVAVGAQRGTCRGRSWGARTHRAVLSVLQASHYYKFKQQFIFPGELHVNWKQPHLNKPCRVLGLLG